MAELTGQLASVGGWYDNPDKTINIDQWDNTDPWWLDDLYYRDMSLATTPYAIGQVISTQPIEFVHWGVQACGIFAPVSPYDGNMVVLMRL